MFANIIGKPFQYEHCWNILKMERKWTSFLTSNKRAKTHSTGSPAESTHVESCHSTPYLGDDTEPSSTPNLDRPLGRKASKKQEIALEQHRKQLEIEERQVQEIQMQNEMKIMETDTTGMDPIYATYWNNLKIEVMKKRGFNF